MKIGNNGQSYAVTICVLAMILAAMNAAPRQTLAQDRPLSPVASTENDLGEALPPHGRPPADGCSPSSPSSASSGFPNFGRIYQVTDADTWGDSVWPTSDGYLLLSDFATADSFALNLTEFNAAGHPVHSQNLSIAPGWPKSARATSDGGYLIGSTIKPTSNSWEGRLLKLGADLSVQWAKAFRTGSPSYAHVSGVAETADGGYIALVRDYSRFGIVKLDSTGSVEWQKGILPGSGTTRTTVYDVIENTYLDGDGRKHCGGYVLYGGIQRPGTDWDIYLAALSCDGSSILWQRIVSGPMWEASHSEGSLFYDDFTNLTVVQERNGVNTQDADLLLAATTDFVWLESIVFARTVQCERRKDFIIDADLRQDQDPGRTRL